MTTTRKASAAPTFPARVRFNWGFHDATADVDTGRAVRDVSGHYDRAYAAGYTAGIAAMVGATERPDSSDAAWAARAR